MAAGTNDDLVRQVTQSSRSDVLVGVDLQRGGATSATPAAVVTAPYNRNSE
jgi:hypothetical protein